MLSSEVRPSSCLSLSAPNGSMPPLHRCSKRLHRSAAVTPFTRARVLVRSVEDEGVLDLLARDRKAVSLAPELLDNFKDAAEEGAQQADTNTDSSSTDSSTTSSSRNSSSRNSRIAVKPRKQRRRDMIQAADSAAAEVVTGPKRCKEAIDKGLELFNQQQYQAAIDMFNLALELPGNGAYRVSGSPREYSCPSDAEENACLYNMACAYAKLGQTGSALTCLEAVLENGFDDVNTLKTDPDLSTIRGRDLDEVIEKYTGIPSKFKKLFAKQEVLVSDSNKNKPWILW